MASPTKRPTNARRTPANKRRGQHILDVNVRAHQASRQRKQRVFGAFSMALIFLGLGAGLFFGGRKLVQRFFLKNPDYNLAVIDVQTDGVLTPDAIMAAAQLEKGTNIFKIDLDGARSRLSTIPEVDKVEVTRQLPDRVAIDITERKPVAWIALAHLNGASREEVVSSGKSLLIDANGIILPPKKPLAQHSHLPIIRGYTGPTILGQKADGEEIWSALDLLHAHQDMMVDAEANSANGKDDPEFREAVRRADRYQIEEVDLSKQFALVVTDQNGSHTTLGLEDMNKQLKKMESILEAAEQRGQKIQTMNLLVENNTPVTFQPAPTPPPSEGVAAPAPIIAAPSPAAAKPAKKAPRKEDKPARSKPAKVAAEPDRKSVV